MYVVSEAKACGLPTVAVDAQGSSFMVKDGYDGFLTKDCVFDFANKVSNLLSNTEQLDLFGKNALKNARENYMAHSITKKLINLYNQLISSRGRT